MIEESGLIKMLTGTPSQVYEGYVSVAEGSVEKALEMMFNSGDRNRSSILYTMTKVYVEKSEMDKVAFIGTLQRIRPNEDFTATKNTYGAQLVRIVENVLGEVHALSIEGQPFTYQSQQIDLEYVVSKFPMRHLTHLQQAFGNLSLDDKERILATGHELHIEKFKDLVEPFKKRKTKSKGTLEYRVTPEGIMVYMATSAFLDFLGKHYDLREIKNESE